MMNDTRHFRVHPQGDHEILIDRHFDAPPDLVWLAVTRSDLLRRWLLGPPGWEMTVCENDVRVGGSFRHAWKKADGTAMAMHGVYQEIVAGRRIVRTEQFDFGCDAQAGEQVATMTLEPLPGRRTHLRISVRYPNRQARDAALQSGMEHGVAASYQRIDGLLGELRAQHGGQ